MNTNFRHLESPITKAIHIMTQAVDAIGSGRFESNSRGYRIMEWACKRYRIPYPAAYPLQMDVLNGYLKA